jgi:hypothetical protein
MIPHEGTIEKESIDLTIVESLINISLRRLTVEAAGPDSTTKQWVHFTLVYGRIEIAEQQKARRMIWMHRDSRRK